MELKIGDKVKLVRDIVNVLGEILAYEGDQFYVMDVGGNNKSIELINCYESDYRLVCQSTDVTKILYSSEFDELLKNFKNNLELRTDKEQEEIFKLLFPSK